MSTVERTGGSELAQLSHHRWAIPVLAEMSHATGGARLANLAHRLGAPPDPLRQAIAALVAAGYVVRNPGHGHPLRPEYLLTEDGTDISQACHEVVDQLDSLAITRVGLKKWTLPVLHETARAMPVGARFGELAQTLPTISPHALSLTLTHLKDHRLVTRHPDPQVRYHLTSRGHALSRPVARLLQVSGC